MPSLIEQVDGITRDVFAAIAGNIRMQRYDATGVSATGASATGVAGTGALAAGVAAIGALAIGALVIGRLRVVEARFDRLHIGTLSVDRVVSGRKRRR
jgi:hypothetical protein